MSRVIYCILLLLSIFGCHGLGNSEKMISKSGFPDFKVQLIDSISSSTSIREVKNGPAVIFIFQPDCPFCMELLKDLINNSTKLKEVNIYMVTIAPFRLMRNYYNEFNLAGQKNITVLRDTDKFSLKYYQVKSVPFLAVYDTNHKLKQIFNGRVDVGEILKAIYD